MPPSRDIPRVSLESTTDGPTNRGLGAPLHVDARNDQHFLLSQVVMIFMALHNDPPDAAH